MSDLDNLLGGQPPAGETTPPAQDTPPEGTTAPTPDNPPAHGNEDNKVIREMRGQINASKEEAAKLQAQLERVAKANGMSVDEYMKHLDEKDIVERADANKIPPELQRQLDENDRRLRMFEENNQKQIFNRNMNELIATQNITEEQAVEFLRNASQRGIDVINSPLSHKELYMALNADSIISGLRETIKQELLVEMKQQGASAPGAGTTGTDSDGKGTLDDFLRDFSKK